MVLCSFQFVEIRAIRVKAVGSGVERRPPARRRVFVRYVPGRRPAFRVLGPASLFLAAMNLFASFVYFAVYQIRSLSRSWLVVEFKIQIDFAILVESVRLKQRLLVMVIRFYEVPDEVIV
jgi:hypothetical protein